MTLYQKFKKLKINFSAIGLEQRNTDTAYFCTPKGARIIGWAGVDGIHYCFVRGQEEMVFAVSPMNTPGRNVFPIARTFAELLGLLLACGSMDAIEQAHQWDDEQFDEYVAENQPTPAACAVFDILRDKLGITPMEQPFTYLRRLQDSYNYGQIKFSKEYYESFDLSVREEMPTWWRVTMEGDFRAERGKAGREITIGKQFSWGDELWHIPAVYLCSGGLVADFCIAVDAQRVQEHFHKARALEERGARPSYEERAQMELANPISIRFHPVLTMNGEILKNRRGRGATYICKDMIGEDSWEDPEAKWVLEHYGLDATKTWVIHRCTFPWEGRRKVEIQSLTLHLERDKVDFPAARFQTPAVGGSVKLAHPITGAEHTLTVREFEAREMDGKRFHDEEFEFPRHLSVMTYTIHPDLPSDAFTLKDCSNGDNPRPRHPDPHGRLAMSVGAIAVVRSVDGSEQVNYMGDDPVKAHAVCSSLHFEPVSAPVEWRVIIREKLMPDMNEILI